MAQARKAPRNRTLSLTDEEVASCRESMVRLTAPASVNDLLGRVICNDLFDILDFLPEQCVDLMVIDPPYNMNKDFHGFKFSKACDAAYEEYLESWFPRLMRMLKPGGSVYVCCDWQNSHIVRRMLERRLTLRNRITWQREKGRGALRNWKNCTEDIWFATLGEKYYYDAESVRLRRRVIAPYRVDGEPKDWHETEDGRFRLTHASNFWDDITVPYWSMPENTDHPTQKSEKLNAKLILASCPPGGVVFDPFLGSGTTAVTAQKLGRKFFGVEINETYCAMALKRLELAAENSTIQGYDTCFNERNARL